MTKLQETYQQFFELGIKDTIKYDSLNAFLLTHHSTKIEGSSLSELDTKLLLEEGITPKGKPLEHSNMVKDHFEALQFVLACAKEKTSITENLIKEIASRVNKTTGKITNTALGSFDDAKGDYRLANAFAGTDYFLAFDKVPDHTRALCKELDLKIKSISGIDEVYQLAFDAHYYLVQIHPFGDGNGRTSRLLMNFVQAYHGYPLTPVFAEDKKEYILALQTSRKEENTQAIRSFMISQSIAYFEREIKAYKNIDRGISFIF